MTGCERESALGFFSIFKMYRTIFKPKPLIATFFRREMGTLLDQVIVCKVEGKKKMLVSFIFKSPSNGNDGLNFEHFQTDRVSKVLPLIGRRFQEMEMNSTRKNPSPPNFDFERYMKSKTEWLGNPREKKEKRESESFIELIRNGASVSERISIASAFEPGTVLRIGDERFHVEVNPPQVIYLSLGRHLMTGFSIHPKLELQFADINKTKFIWFRSISQFHGASQSDVEAIPVDKSLIEWELIGEGLNFTYKPGIEDIGRFVKFQCVPVDDSGRVGHSRETISEEAIKAGPEEIPFQRRHLHTNKFTEPGSFRIVSYNILADQYTDEDFFHSSPPQILDRDYRMRLMADEICGYKSDIICLQEVSTKTFYNYLLYIMEKHNMKGTLARKLNFTNEGTACLFRRDKFRLVDRKRAGLCDLVRSDHEGYRKIYEAIKENSNLHRHFTERNTIIQTTILEPIDEIAGQPLLCVANVHLYYHPEADTIRLLQVGVCLRFLERLMDEYQRPMAFVFCGDFNSSPDEGIYELLTDHVIREDHEAWRKIPEEAIAGISLKHGIDFMCASGTPEYTNFNDSYFGCLDYIFADQKLLEVEEVVPLPTHEEVTRYKVLPSITMPSDHIALVCTLKWKN